MISNAPSSAYVWTWLNRRTQPVVAGVITRQARRHFFSYGKSYLARADAVPLAPELPLQSGVIEPMHDLAGALRDASPDSWGRRVIAAGLMGQGEDDLNTSAIDELTYFLQSGSNRIGALDFQRSPTEYVSRNSPSATLEELMESADKIEAGEKLHPDIDPARVHVVHNWSWDATRIDLPEPLVDVLADVPDEPMTQLELGAWDVRVLGEADAQRLGLCRGNEKCKRERREPSHGDPPGGWKAA